MPTSTKNNVFVGNNFDGDEVLYLTGQVPEPNGLVVDSNPIQFVIAARGGAVELSTVRIVISGNVIFDGVSSNFSPAYSTSTFEETDDGYLFSLINSAAYTISVITLVVIARTSNNELVTLIYSIRVLQTVEYSTQPESALTTIPVEYMTGECDTGYFSGSAGLVFASPSLFIANPSVTLDIDDIEVRTHTADHYDIPQTDNSRPFVFGPPLASPPPGAPIFPPYPTPDYLPVFNDPTFTFIKTTGASIVGVLHDTTFDEDIVILY